MYYLKLYYKLLNWEWYSNANVMRLFIHCLLKANVKSKKWQGVVIERGSFITSYEKLSAELGLTTQQIRTAISKLKITGEITIKSHSHYSIISLKNWDEYQPDNKQNNNQITNKQQTNNKQITTTKECKNDIECKNVLIGEEKIKKIDPYSNPFIDIFKIEYEKHFGARLYLTAQERLKIVELSSEIEDFKETIPIVVAKLKKIDFGFENFTPNVNWLLKESNYTAVLNGTYDRQESAEDRIFNKLRERSLNG